MPVFYRIILWKTLLWTGMYLHAQTKLLMESNGSFRESLLMLFSLILLLNQAN